MTWLDPVLRLVHAVVGGVWLGSVYFSLMILHRQSPELFETLEEFEAYVTGLSDGNRWRVLSALGTTAGTGLLLAARLSDQLGWNLWTGLMAAKLAAVLVTGAVFSYVSWWLWPQRIFADRDELPELQRRGTILRATMFSMIAVGFALGILAHTV